MPMPLCGQHGLCRPKPGRPKPEGWEHIEVALGVGAMLDSVA